MHAFTSCCEGSAPQFAGLLGLRPKTHTINCTCERHAHPRECTHTSVASPAVPSCEHPVCP
eukprot:194239-Alexandrium_andersonii.AAC.1